MNNLDPLLSEVGSPLPFGTSNSPGFPGEENAFDLPTSGPTALVGVTSEPLQIPLSLTEFPSEGQGVEAFEFGNPTVGGATQGDADRDRLTGLADEGLWVDSLSSTQSLLPLAPITPQADTLTPVAGDLFIVPGSVGEAITIRFQWTFREAAYNNEVGLFVLDAQGRVNGVAPGEAGFAYAAMTSASRQVLFSSGQRSGAWQELTFQGGDRLAFYLIQNSSTDEWLRRNPTNVGGNGPVAFFSVDGVNPDGFDHVYTQTYQPGLQTFHWEDLWGGGDRDFDDVVFLVSQVGLPIPGELGQFAPLTVKWISKEASFRNEMGFFIVDDVTGRIGDLMPGDAGYAAAALGGNRSQMLFAQSQGPGQMGQYDLPSGQYLGWYLIQNATTEQWLSQNPFNQIGQGPLAFFSYSGANPDGLSHVHYRNGNEMVWEDQTGGGDRDYDDLIFRFEIEAPPAIHKTEAPPLISIDDIRVLEGDEGFGEAVFTVSLSKASINPIVVDFETIEGTATAGRDFQAMKGRLAFAPGERTKSLSVQLIWDLEEEDDETFFVQLSNASYGILAKDKGIAIIEDNDTKSLLPFISIDDVSILEGNEGTRDLIFTVQLSEATNLPVSVDYLTEDISARALLDYLPTSGSLTFQPGDPLSQSIVVSVIGDLLPELDETFSLKLSNVINATIAKSEGIGTIEDDDQLEGILLKEETFFHVFQEVDLVIPAEPSILSFSFADLNFDTQDLGFINDAFEAALVDAEGNSLVHTIGVGKTAFFNFSEGLEPELAAGVTLVDQTIQVNLADILPGTEAKLIFRLVNNDSDTETSVYITQIDLLPGGDTAPTIILGSDQRMASTQPVSFTYLVDVSASVGAVYGQTSLNQNTAVLSTNLALQNVGNYSLNAPLVVAIANLSDPTVQVVGADGITPDGLPYFDFSSLINQPLDPNGITSSKVITFNNPQGIQFTYDLVVLADLNAKPVIESTPNLEILGGQTYSYDVNATDPDADTLSYSLVVAPAGMTIDQQTGLITWDTTLDDIANHAVTIQVNDGRGGVVEQTYSLSVIAEPPNRPPLFTSIPLVDARINQPYIYDADAIDPDQDSIIYRLILGPEGMTIDPATGVVAWTPPPVFALGDTILGRISLPGDSSEFSFSGVIGQRLYLDGLQSFSGFRTTIYSPTGRLVQLENDLLRLTETGTYRIVVDSSGDSTGSYGFSLVDPALLPEAPFDTVITGQLSPGSEDDLFRFRGFKGQKIFLNQLSNSGRVSWALLDEGNRIVAQDSLMRDLEFYLPSDGEYILTLRGQEAFSTVINYSFEIVTLEEITAPLTLGSNDEPNSISGRINRPGEEDFFTFEGSIGQRLYLDRLNSINNSAIKITIESPSGNEYLSYVDNRGRSIRQDFNSGHEWAPITLIEEGLYRVRIDGEGDQVGDYNFSLRDLALASTVDLDQTYSNILEPGEASHLYQFTASADQRLFIDFQDDSGTGSNDRARWVLYDAGNQVVASDYTGRLIEVVIDEDGTYTLAVEGDREEISVNYSFEIITPDTIIKPLAFNTPTFDSITEKGEQDVFLFDAYEGQRVFLDILQGSNHLVSLITPSGQKIYNNTGAQSDSEVYDQYVASWWSLAQRGQGALILPEAGVYQLIFDGYEGNVADYAFQLLNVSQAPLLLPETVVAKTLTPGNSIEFYKIEGKQGDRLYLNINTASQSLYSHIYGPGNQLIDRTSPSRFGNQLDQEVVLPGDGIYYLMVRGESTTPISYEMQIVQTSAVFENIGLNASINGAIDRFGQQNTYTFSGNLGQRVVIDAITGSSAITFELRNPSGNVIYSGNSLTDSAPFTLLESGDYTVTVDGAGKTTGNYSFALREEASPLLFGTSINDSLAAREIRLYQLMGTAGQTVKFDSLNAVPGANWVLYGPDNIQLSTANLNADFTRVLPLDGKYLLALRNGGDSDISYGIQVDDISPAAVTPNGLGQTYRGEISTIGEVDTYTFAANSGTTVYFDSLEIESGIYVNLVNPDGTALSSVPVGNGIDRILPLSQSGTYTLRVQGFSNTIGGFAFRLLDLDQAASILNLGNQIEIAVNPNEVKVYKFDGEVGQKLFFDGLNSTNVGVTAQLLDASGRGLREFNTVSDFGLQTLLTDGTYYLTLASTGTTSATASFRLLNASSGIPLTLDTDISGTFGTSGRESIIYNFVGQAGQKLFFDQSAPQYAGAFSSFKNTYSLYSPDGQLIFSQRLDTDRDYLENQNNDRLPGDGIYTLVISGNGELNNNYQLRLVTPEDEISAINIGEVANGAITEVGQTNTHTFIGLANQRIIFDNLSQPNINALLARIYSPTGALIREYNFNQEDPEAFILREEGTYRVVVDATGSNTTAYSFRLLDMATATPLNLDTTFNGSLGASGLETHLYHFEGIKGQKIYFDRFEGAIQNRYALYSPSNEQLFSQRLDLDYELEALPADGIYTLAILGNGGSNTSYRMELVTPGDLTSEYTFGETISGAISESGKTDSYTFTGQAGQIIWFDSLLSDSSANLFVYLNSPSGKLYNWTRSNWGQESLWLMRQYAGQQPANVNAKAIVLEEAGTYTIQVDGDGDTKGAYAFRFLDFADAPVVELDTDFGGTFGDSGLEATVYRFTGTEGQHLFFKRNIGERNFGQNEVHLFDSFGNQVFSNDLFNAGRREITTLTRSGEYYLVFSGGNSANNSYNFRIVTPEVITTEYAIGELISAEISEAGEQDWYTFEGTVGQSVFVDSLSTTNTEIVPTLYSPSGKTISWGQRFNQDAQDLIVFEETGTYSLKVDVVGDGIGQYGFRILDIAEAGQLTFNTPITGNFGDSGFESRLYKFAGEQGDRIYFDGIGTEQNGTYSLYRVSGDRLFWNRDITSDEDFVLSATGDYLLAITGKGGSNNTFTMEVVKPDLLQTSISLGAVTSGEISAAGQRDTYTFDGRVGQQLFLDALSANSGLSMQLISPTGRIVSNNQSHQDWGPVTLTENGTYQLVINGTYHWYIGIDRFNTGAYSFILNDLSQVPELAINAPVAGSLVPGSSVALYQFRGTKGTTLTFDLAASQWSGASWVLYDPGSQPMASPTANNPDFKVALTTDGQYTLAIRGASNSPINYEFLVVDTTIPAIENTGFNVVESGTITSAGQVDRYSFDATAGTLAFFDSQDFSSAGGLRFRLINPDGSFAINNGDMRFDRVPNDFKLNQTGTYSLEVYGFNNTGTGTYRFQLLELSTESSSLNDSRSLDLGAVVADSLEVGRAATVYNFEGSLGEQIYLNGINTTGITARLIAPNGSEVFSLSNVWSSQDSGPHVLNQTGQYSLIIQGEQSSSVDYAFQLFSFNKAESLLFNLPNTGSLNSGLEQKTYQFNGQSRQTLFFDSQVNSNNDWKLYGPNGLLVRNNRLSNDFEATLTQDGLYTLLLGGSFENQLDYRFRVFSYDEIEPFGAIIPGTGENSSSDGLSLGSFPVQLSAEDGRGGFGFQNYQIRLLPDSDNNTPVITSLPETSMGLNQGVYAYQIESFDLDNDQLVYRLIKSPSGSLINQVTGKVLWLPEGQLTVGDEYEFTVEVNDPRGGSAQQSFTVRIEDNDVRKGFGEIRGTIWDDVNSDRQRNVDEKGKAGIQVYLDLNANGRIDPGEPVDVTAIDDPFTPDIDETGQFKFTNLAPGTYLVRTVEPDGWVQTFPNEPLRVRDDGVLLASNLSLLQPDPNIAATFIGRAGISTDGFGSNENFNRGGVGFIQAEIPEGSTVEYAFLHVASRAFGDVFNPETAFRPGFVGFEGTQVPITWLDKVQDVAPRLNFETGRADVTSTVAAKIGNQGGIFNFELDESIIPQTWDKQIEGISLTVIYSNPNLPEKTIVVLEGGLAGATPQTNVLLLQEPVDTTAPGFSSQLALGIQYGYQPRNSRGTQFSTIDINGERLTSSAGNSDDGIMIRQPFVSVNGALITVGGVGDSLANPIDPYGDSYDDEFYTLVPFLRDGDTALRIETANPSNDDSIFLAALTIPSVARLDSSGFLSINVSPEEIVENVDFGISKTAAVIQNSAPTFISVPPASITVGSQLRYQAEAIDNLPENDWVYYDLLVNPVGMVIDPNTGVVFWNPTSEQTGTVDVVIRAQDLYGGRDLQYFQLEVSPPNSAPSFTSSLSPNTPQVGKPFQYNALAIDPDDDPVTYGLANGAPTGMVVDAITGMLTWTATATQLGNHDVRLIAKDDKGAETTQALSLTVIEAQPNTTPQITSQPRVTTRVNAPYLYQLIVQEPDGDPIAYNLVNAPEGMTLNERGLLAWQPTASQTGAHTITITVEDRQGGSDTQTYSLGVRNQVGNYAPEITSEPQYLTNIDRPYQYQAAAVDPDGDALFWELATAPQGMVVGAQTGTVSWQPGIAQVGEHVVTLQATDMLGSFATQTFTLAVRGTNTPPQITSTPPTQIGIEQPYRYQIQAVDPEGDRIEFKLGRHPSGMTLDPTTGDLLWIPQPGQIGFHDIELVAQDTQGGIGRQTYTLLVARDAVNQAPTITSSPGFWADVATGYQYQVAASDPDGDPIAFSVLTGPTGMTIDPVTGLLQWQPTAAQLGQQTVTVAAFDPLGMGGLQTYSLRVTEANQAPVIRSTPILTVAAEATYRYDLWASDSDGEPITLSLNRGPEGMVMDELGRITWVTSNGDVGTYPIEIAVADSRGAVTLQTFNLAVQADILAPRVSLAVSAVQVNLGETVTLKVSASDNVGVEFLTLTVNGEAIALDAQGLATATLNNAGSFDVVATATDAAGNIGTATSTLFVLDPSDPEAPVVSLISLAGGALFSTLITAPINIIGTVTDDNLLYYSLAIAPMAGGVYTEIYRGTGAITNGILGNFDPSTLLNDTYRLRLTATDAGGNTAYDETLVDVTGELKLGNFQLSFTDLSIPVAGMPIQVTRTYDTLTANTRDDFGYGWRLEFRDTDLRTSLGPDLELQELGIASKGFSVGDRVYITLPGGKREGFTFRPTLNPINRFIPIASNGSRLYRPAFEADPGVTSTLTVQRVDLIQLENGEFASLNGGRYNPANELYGFGGYYQLTTKEGIVYRIDAETGDLDTITDRNNNTLTFTDSSITSSTGQRVTFERDAQGRITAAIDPEGNRVTYQYDALGDLIAVTDREGHTIQFGYDSDRPHYLDEIIDPLGRTGIRSEYDENGRLKRLIDANGNPVELIYDPANDLQQVRDQLGHITTYEYDQRGNVLTEIDSLGGITRRSYDANNYMLTETDPLGNTTAFTYNAKGDVLTETDALGNVTRYTYDANGNILTTTDPTGQTTTNTYDARGNLTQISGQASGPLGFSYDARGNLATMQDGSGTTTFEYDAIGNITRQTNARGTVTSFTYDPKGNRTSETTTQTLADGTLRTLVTRMEYDKEGRPIRTTDAEGGVSETRYDTAGNRVETIDALGRSTKYLYDERGQLIATLYPDVTPDDDSDNPRTRTEYDAKGQVIAQIDELGRRTVMIYDTLGRQIATLYPDATTGDDSDNPRTQTVYDAAGRVVAQIDERGNRTEFRYDAAGRVIETILPDETPDDLSDNPRFITVYDAAGRQLTQTDSLGQVTQFLYDALGRPVGQRYADGTSTSVNYDAAGRVAARTDQAGVTTRYEHDALGRLTAVVDALNHRTTYTYDEQGNLLTQTDANGNATRYEYDRLGRRVATELPLGERSTTSYNAVGNLISTTDFNGAIKTYAYDERNRLIAKDLPDTEFDETHTYLANGLRNTVTDGRGTTTYRYDERNRLSRRIDPDGTTIAYSYDAAGNRTSVQIPSGTTAYGFDAQNRLKTVTDPEGGVTTYTYNPVGNLARTEFPNGTVEIREYDDLNRLLYIETSGPAGIIASFRYTLDATGNREEVVEHDGRRVVYEYDDLYSLEAEIIYDPGATGPSRIIDYIYDDVGNRLSRTDTGEGTTFYTYDDNDQLLTATTDGVATTYTYDKNGNTTSKTTDGTTILYDWNADNRLIGADTDGDGVIDVENRYNENGIRVSQTVNGEETRFLIDTNRDYAQVLEEYTPGGIIKVSYVHGNDLISQNRAGTKSFYHVDGLGSTRALSGKAGLKSDQYIYDAYGQIINSIGDTENSYFFAGEQRDSNIGMDYLRARYLETDIGRFFGRDPFFGFLEDPLSINKYLYVHSNPVNNIDPTGLYTLSQKLAATVVLGALVPQAILFPSGVFAGAVSGDGKGVKWEADIVTTSFAARPAIDVVSVGFSAKSEKVKLRSGEIKQFEGIWALPLISLGVSLKSGFSASSGDLTIPALFLRDELLAARGFEGPSYFYDLSAGYGVGLSATFAFIGFGFGSFSGAFYGYGAGLTKAIGWSANVAINRL